MMTLRDFNTLFGSPIHGDVDLEQSVIGFSIDSRRLKPGQVFIAIQGETFDGHDYIQQAVSQGALAVICARPLSSIPIPQWVVSDTIVALAELAAFHRRRHPCPAIALTGSNGKTTVKEMIASILPQPSLATRGNLNNHIGAPLSVLELKEDHRYAVFELGASHRGEIAYTVGIVQPQVTLINNIAPAHIEGFGSLDGVAQAKGEIHEGLVSGGTAIINDDDAYAHFWDTSFTGKTVLHFSMKHPADVHADSLIFNSDGCAQFRLITPAGDATVELNVPGAHNVLNALAAAACTTALHIELSDIAAGLNAFHGVAGRMTYRRGKNNALIIDDTYNANLRSMLVAIEVLSQRPGQRILVIGDMKELGELSQVHHQEIGQMAHDRGIDLLLSCGSQSRWASLAFGEGAHHFETQDALIDDLLSRLDEQSTVLVKGSRSSAMEYIVQHLLVEHDTISPQVTD